MAILAFRFPVFKPAMRIVTSITNSNPVIVTTSFANSYITGLICRLYIPRGFGMQQANLFNGEITVINTTQFSMPLDTTLFDPFVIPAINPGHFFTPAQIVPTGENSLMLTGATMNVLPYP